MREPELILDEVAGEPTVRGILHRAAHEKGNGIVLTHSAGSNCNSPLLIALAETLATEITVLRCDLPFRQARPHGPPLGNQETDQAGLRRAVEVLRKIVSGRVFLGGHSYGGRMATLLAAQQPTVAAGLLLLSYPLHPPGKPQQLRTAHFPRLQTKSLFVHGVRDGFASTEEMQSALKLIAAETKLFTIEGAGHELMTKKNRAQLTGEVSEQFQNWLLAE